MALAVDQRILERAATTDFVVSRRQLMDAGVSAASIARRVGRTLTPVASGVYIIGQPSDPKLLRAALLVVDGSVVADEVAARLLGLPVSRRADQMPTIVAPKGASGRPPVGIHVRHTRHLPVCDTTVAEGFASTTVERTICDFGRMFPVVRVQHLIEWAITERKMSRQSFSACVRSFCRRGREGSSVLRVLRHELLDDGLVPASTLERKARDLLDREGLSGYEMHFVPPWSDGVTGTVDLAWTSANVIVELDGRRWHSVTQAQLTDRQRDRTANAHGWTVLRFGWQEVVERPSQVGAEIRSFLRRHSRLS